MLLWKSEEKGDMQLGGFCLFPCTACPVKDTSLSLSIQLPINLDANFRTKIKEEGEQSEKWHIFLAILSFAWLKLLKAGQSSKTLDI
jgi:hypothetical protein